MISFKRKNQGCGQLGILRSLGSVVFVVILCFWIVVTVTAPGVDQKKIYIYIYKDNVLYAMNTSLFLFCGSVHTRTLQDKKGMRLGPFAPLLKRCGRSEVGPAVHQNMFSSNNRGD